MLKYLRYRAFQVLLQPFSSRARSKRMQTMLRLAGVGEGASVLDLGGNPQIWEYPFFPRLNITILNLPGETRKEIASPRHNYQYVEGDACNINDIADDSYDLVFSNSVIEHVGGPDRQAQFAGQVRRLGQKYWVQTPAIWFPIEAHTGMPFWWFYPRALQKSIIRRWHEKLPSWTEMIAGTTVIKRRELQQLFPEGTIFVERVLGIPKSYAVVKAA